MVAQNHNNNNRGREFFCVNFSFVCGAAAQATSFPAGSIIKYYYEGCGGWVREGGVDGGGGWASSREERECVCV